MRRLLPVLLVLAVACASSKPNPFRPSVTIEQLNPINFGATTRAPITVAVYLKNVSPEHLTIRNIRIESGLTQQYVVGTEERSMREAVPPGDYAEFRISMTAISQQGRIQDPEPLNLRAFVTYDVAGKQYQDLYLFRALMQ